MTAPVPPAPHPTLANTGERLIPGVPGSMEIEHLHRYALAISLASDKVVLDLASGEGYGSNLLAQTARTVYGIDIAPDAIQAAQAKYTRANLQFIAGSGTEIPLPAGAVDLIASFETIEHLADHDRLLAEFRRVLRPGGLLLISSPNKAEYSDKPDYHNPFHVRELYLQEFRDLLARYFPNISFLGQRVTLGSLITPIEPGPSSFQSFAGGCDQIAPSAEPPLYYVALASDAPLPAVSSSLFDGTSVLQYQAEKRREYELYASDRIHQLQLHADNIQAELQRSHDHSKQLTLHAENLTTELQRMRDYNQQLTLHTDNLMAELQRTSDHNQQLTLHTDNLTAELQRTRGQIDQLTLHAKNADGELQRLNVELQTSRDRFVQLTSEDQNLHAEFDRRRAELESAQAQLSTIQQSRFWHFGQNFAKVAFFARLLGIPNAKGPAPRPAK